MVRDFPEPSQSNVCMSLDYYLLINDPDFNIKCQPIFLLV